jgi:hypothetical protein
MIEVATITSTGYSQPTQCPLPPGLGCVQSFSFASVNARYIKIEATYLSLDETGARYRMAFAEVQAFGGNLAAFSANLSAWPRATAASSSYEDAAGGWGIAYATDGARLSTPNYYQGWSSEDWDNTPNIAIDLGAISEVTRVCLYPRNDGANAGLCYPSSFYIQTSLTGASSSYSNAVTLTSEPIPTNQKCYTIPSVYKRTRFIRVQAAQGGLRNGKMQFAEIAVY